MELYGKFSKAKLIGSGSFSKVYKCKYTKINEYVALKVSPLTYKSHIENEEKIMKSLPSNSYFPELKWVGKYNEQCILASSLLGQNLENLLRSNKLKSAYSLKILIQMFKALCILHERGYIHKDIKPANICRGNKEKKKAYLIDFGISEAYCNIHTKQHFPRKDNNLFRGNYAFCSNNAICGVSASRRDDLESLSYVAIYLFKKSLP